MEDFQHDFGHAWYKRCVELAHEYEWGSPEYLFWWSLRMEFNSLEAAFLWLNHPLRAFEDWCKYLLFKFEQFEQNETSTSK